MINPMFLREHRVLNLIHLAYTFLGGEFMPYEEKRNMPVKYHSLSLEGREKLSISGVEDVSGFDETLVVLSTAQGDLSIRGSQLHIERIDLEAGQLEVRGHVQELSYDEPNRSGSLWSRLFG